MDVVGVVGVVVEVCWSLLAIVLVFGFGLVLESALMPFFVVVPLASRPAARPLHRVSGGTSAETKDKKEAEPSTIMPWIKATTT